ncbi:MAG: hypothetical protein ABEJ75_03570 [Candidatus Nanohaloarchaea archaeon]
MVQLVLNAQTVELVNSLLLVPLLLLAILLLYRLNRIFEYGESSVESLEKTAENVEASSETVDDVVGLARKIPLVGGRRD